MIDSRLQNKTESGEHDASAFPFMGGVTNFRSFHAGDLAPNAFTNASFDPTRAPDGSGNTLLKNVTLLLRGKRPVHFVARSNEWPL